MIKSTFLKIFAATLLIAGVAHAQQTPSTNSTTTPPPAKSAPAAKAPTAKSGTSAATKAPAAKSSTATAPTSPKDKASYAIGLNIGKGMHKDEVDVNPEMIYEGLKDGYSGGKALMTDDEVKSVLTALQAHIRQMMEERAKAVAEANKKEGADFLEANKTKDGVVALPDGLQYKILTAGTGPKPAPTDSVVCNYRGTLINGTEFDSSYKRGQPATFGVNQVIKGWTEALQLMPVGSKWQLFLPSDLAYGDRGAGADIGPNATLIFEVELLSIQSKDQAQPPAQPAAK